MSVKCLYMILAPRALLIPVQIFSIACLTPRHTNLTHVLAMSHSFCRREVEISGTRLVVACQQTPDRVPAGVPVMAAAAADLPRAQSSCECLSPQWRGQSQCHVRRMRLQHEPVRLSPRLWRAGALALVLG